MPPIITATWFVFAGGISALGTGLVLWFVAPHLDLGWAVAAWVTLGVTVAALAYTFWSNARDSRRVVEWLGVPPRSGWSAELERLGSAKPNLLTTQ